MVNVEKLLKYFTIFSWSLAILALIIYIISTIVHGNFSFYDFIKDELTFILMPFVLIGAYLISFLYLQLNLYNELLMTSL